MTRLARGMGLLGLLVPRHAPADEPAPPAIEARLEEAALACSAGDPDRGVAILGALHLQTGEPNALFNQGLCLERNGRPADAIPRYEAFLRAPGLDAEAQRQGEERLAACRAAIPRRSPWAFALVATGGVAIGAGAFFGWRTQVAARSFERDVVDRRLPYDPERAARGRRLERAQWLSYGVGAVAVGAGLAWLLLEDGGGQEVPVSAAVSPGATGLAFGLVWRGRL